MYIILIEKKKKRKEEDEWKAGRTAGLRRWGETGREEIGGLGARVLKMCSH